MAVSGIYAADTLWVDIENAEITWTGRKIGGEHNGTISLSKGWVLIENDLVTGGEFIFDMNTIKNLDVKSTKWRQKLESHLKNEDFFDTAIFPTAALKVNGSSKSAGKDETENYIIQSKLTIKNITKDFAFPVKILKTEKGYTAEGSMDIDRTDFGIQYKSSKFFPSLGDKIIEDVFTVQVSLSTK